MQNALFFACLLLVVSPLLKADIKIDPSKAVICVTDNRTNKTAADELKKHLDLIGTANIPIVPENKIVPGSFVFYVGKIPAGVKADFKPEEARWVITSDAAYFFGGNRNGTQNAVYSFLEDELGVRWPSGDDIAFKVQHPIVVKTLQGLWLPEITYRSFRDYNKGTPPEQSIWKRRLRQGTDGSWNYGPGDAMYAKWWKLYGKDHPEYFAMNINGVRGPAPSRLKGTPADDPIAYAGKDLLVAFCCTSEPLVKAVVEKWDKKDWLNLFQPDLYDFEACYCEKCRALDSVPVKKGEKFSGNNLSDRYVYFANRVYEEAKKINPNVRVITGIYNASEQPPKRQKITGDIVYSVVPTDFTMDGIEKCLGGWKKAGMKKMYYRPNRHGYFLTVIPAGYEKYFYRVFQYMYKAGALGFDYDVDDTFLHSGQWLSDYVLLKGTQNPSKSFEDWEKQYMQAFAPAEKEISGYYRYWREEVWEKRLEKSMAYLAEVGSYFNFGRGLARNLDAYYRESDFDATDKILAQALQRKDLSANVRARIERLAVDNTHARLIYRAIVKKTDADSLALLKFREKYQYPLFPWCEQYWGDICGLKRVQDLKTFSPPFVCTPVFWFFRLDPADAGMKEEWFKDDFGKIVKWGAYMDTNTCWETPHKHYKLISDDIRKKTANYDGVAWYAVPLEKFPLDWKGRKVFLYFGAVDESCKVWVNGKYAGEHPFVKPDDWRTPFSIEITDCVNWDKATQIVIVRVEDKSGAGGIWKPVWLVSRAEK